MLVLFKSFFRNSTTDFRMELIGVNTRNIVFGNFRFKICRMFFRGNGVILKTNDRQIGEHIFKIDEVGPRLIYLRFRGKKKTLRHLKCPEKTSNVLK